MYLPRSLAGMMSAMMACDRIISPPPPRPWKPRQAMSSQKVCAMPDPKEPTTKIAIATRKMTFLPHMSPNFPYSGMTMVIASR